MAAKFRPHTREKYQKAVGKTDGDSVTEKKGTVVEVDQSEPAGPDPSPLTTALLKSKEAADRGLDTDERLEGEEDSPDFDRESLKKPKPKEKEAKDAKEEKEEKEEEHDEVLEDKKEKQKKTESLTDEEIDGIDESTLTDKSGRPPSREAWATVKLLKQKIKDEREAHKAALEEAAKKPIVVEEAPEFKSLKDEHDKLKKTLDERFFEQSPDFINSFVTPFKEKEAEVAEWIGTANIEADSAEHAEISAAIDKLQKAMDAGKKTEYFIAAAKVGQFLEPGISQQFLIAATEMYPLYQKRKEAFADKDKARKSVTDAELNQVDSAAKTIEKTMEEIFGGYEAENAELLKFYRSENVKDLIPYDSIVSEGKKVVKDMLREFIATRKPTEKFVRLLGDAILKPFKDKEVEALYLALKDKDSKIKNLMEELDKKRATVKKFAATKGVHSSKDDDSDDDEKISSTPLSDRLKEMQGAR